MVKTSAVIMESEDTSMCFYSYNCKFICNEYIVYFLEYLPLFFCLVCFNGKCIEFKLLNRLPRIFKGLENFLKFVL